MGCTDSEEGETYMCAICKFLVSGKHWTQHTHWTNILWNIPYTALPGFLESFLVGQPLVEVSLELQL